MVGRNLLCVEGGEILSGDKLTEAQGWDILRMDWPLNERTLNYSKTRTKWTKKRHIYKNILMQRICTLVTLIHKQFTFQCDIVNCVCIKFYSEIYLICDLIYKFCKLTWNDAVIQQCEYTFYLTWNVTQQLLTARNDISDFLLKPLQHAHGRIKSVTSVLSCISYSNTSGGVLSQGFREHVSQLFVSFFRFLEAWATR